MHNPSSATFLPFPLPFDAYNEHFNLLMRYQSQHERAYNACFNQLLKLRAERRSAKIRFERQKQAGQQVEERKQRREMVQNARQVDIDWKTLRTLRTAANNPQALDAARKGPNAAPSRLKPLEHRMH